MAPEEHKEVFWTTETLAEECRTQTVVPNSAEKRKWDIVWKNVFTLTALHIGAVYGSYLFFVRVMWKTCVFVYILVILSGLGITAGAHRLWSHKSYKANLPLRILLVICNTLAFQDPVLIWARDHRMHHKYSETDADPYNATRGFFFSHIGWLLVRKHPQIKAKAHTVDMDDLRSDPLLRFQKKYYRPLIFLIWLVIPTYVPTLWGESPTQSLFVATVFRYIYVLNGTWLINSAAHMWGNKPYDKNTGAVEVNKGISFMTLGEGFHNYHHTFPWDYKTAELGFVSNLTRIFIDAMAKIGWAYDLKTASQDVVEKRVRRTGDGTHAAVME